MSLQKRSTLIWLLLYVNTATQFQENRETPKCNYINATFDDTCCPYCTNPQNDSCKTNGCPKDYYQLKGNCYGENHKFKSNMFVCKKKCPLSHYGIIINEKKVCLICKILCQDTYLETTCSCGDIHKKTQLKEILFYIVIGISVFFALAFVLMVVYVCCKKRSGDKEHSSTKCIQIDEGEIRENSISFNAVKRDEENLSGQQKASIFAIEAERELDKKTRYTKDPTTTVEPEKKFQTLQSDRPLSSAYVNSTSIRLNEIITENNEMNKTRFKDTKCNLPSINDDESKIKLSKGGNCPSELQIVDRSVTVPISTTLDVTNGNAPTEDYKEGDYDTVEEDPYENGFESLIFQDGTNEITDIENITKSKKQGLVKGQKAARSIKKCKKSDKNKKNTLESDTGIKHRAIDITSSSVETGKSECPKSDLMLESKTIISEPFVQTLPESDAHQYENFQGSISDVDNIKLSGFTTSENTPPPIMRKYANINVNEKAASANKHSNRSSQDSSDSNKSDYSYKSACSHISLSVEPISSNNEETIIEIDKTNIASIKNDVNNVEVEVTKIASQPNINIINGTNVSLNLVYNQKN